VLASLNHPNIAAICARWPVRSSYSSSPS
jgi:hypothetical protein